MPLNQEIFSPLTNYSGSISAFTSDNYTVLQPISSSLPAYQNTGWEYRIMIYPTTSVSATQVIVNDLNLILQNNRKYVIEAYLQGSTSATANGLRVGVSSSAAVETYYAIEVPTTTTAVGYAFNTTNLAGSGPGNNIGDYYFIHIKALAITRPTGVATWAPTISSENAGGGSTPVSMGPSIIYYRQY